MLNKPNQLEGYFLDLSTWGAGKHKNTQAKKDEPLPIPAKLSSLENKSINDDNGSNKIHSSPLQSRYKEFDFTSIRDTLKVRPITAKVILKGLVIGMLFSIPIAPIAYPLGIKGCPIIIAIVSLVATAYCYREYKKTMDADILLTQPLLTPIMNVSNANGKRKEADLEEGTRSEIK